MFSTFAKKATGLGAGTQAIDAEQPKQELIIPADSIKRLEDTATGCVVAWLENNELLSCTIEGTAHENHERLRQEELKLLDEAQRLQQRQSNGLPMLPVQRGRPQ